MKNDACESISTNNDDGDDNDDIFGALAMGQRVFQGFYLDNLSRGSEQPHEESNSITPHFAD